jgi:serine-type D-Ala-D-Ala carboxypeptidase (penicillin-binding protein 5/6)
MSSGRHGSPAAALLLLLALLVPASAAARGPAVEARAWTVIDARSGDVLASHAAAEPLLVASATKLMTAYVAMRELPFDRTVRAASYEAGYGESLLGLRTGERISVRDLIYGLILLSGNDAAHTLAVAAAGSEASFVRQMNRYAAALGLADTHYANPIGLDQSGNHSSARDLATLTRRLLRDPTFARIAATRSVLLRSVRPPRRIETINELLGIAPWVTGVKTGHTFGAGYVLVGSGERKGVELVSVAIGSPSDEARYRANLELLEYGFSRYRKRTPVRAGAAIAEPGVEYEDEGLPLRAARTVTVGIRPDQRLALAVRAPAEVEGPIRRGAVLGRATISVDGRRIAVVPLRASRVVPEAGMFERAGSFIDDNAILIVLALSGILGGAVLLRRQTR